MLKRADLSAETIEWLEWYNELTEEEQLSINYIPGEIHSILFGDATGGMEEVAESDSWSQTDYSKAHSQSAGCFRRF